MTHTVADRQLRCLVVEDEEDVAELIEYALRKDGFSVDRAGTAEVALDICKTDEPDVIILDLDLPGMNGHEMARELRRFSDTYIVMVSGHGTANDRLQALSTTIDDYVSKPFSRAELLARVHALLRRPRNMNKATNQQSRVSVNGLGRSIAIDGNTLTLTTLEFDLLSRLAASMPETVSKSELITSAWGSAGAATPHILNVHVHNLRRKLERVDPNIIIESVRGTGFRLLDRKT